MFGVTGANHAIVRNSEIIKSGMSVSSSRPAGANVDAFESNQGGQQVMDERLAELIRLVESTGRLAPAPAETGSKREPEPRRPPFEPAPAAPGAVTPVEVDVSRAFESGDRPFLQEGGKPPTHRLSRAWMLKASALVVAGAALLGAGFGLVAGKSGAPKAPPVVAAAQIPARTAPQPSPEPAAAAGGAGAISPKDVQPASANAAASGRGPTDVAARVSPGDASQPPALAPVRPAQRADDASAEPSASAPAGRSAVANSPSPQTAPPTPDSGPASQASLPRPAAASATTVSSVAVPDRSAHLGDAPVEPPKKAASAETAPAAAEQRPPPKPELTVMPPKRPPARLVVAKAEAPAPGGEAQPASEPPHSGATIIAPQPVAEPQAPPPAPTSILARPLAPLQHAFNTVVGSLAPAASAPRPVEPAASARSDDWAVQFAAPKTESQATNDASRLNAKYAAALNGAKISVLKTQANGGIVYALRASGLTRAEAAALCERVKGRDCSIAK